MIQNISGKAFLKLLFSPPRIVKRLIFISNFRRVDVPTKNRDRFSIFYFKKKDQMSEN